LLLSVWKFTQAPLHRLKPPLHVKPHVPFEQPLDAFATVGQTLVHEPQWAVSVSSSTQKPLHSEYPETHVNEQALLMHAAFALTTPVEHEAQVPPLPQAVGDVPAWHVPAWQQPLVHAWPQLPQFA
jgi:hypothetical protein